MILPLAKGGLPPDLIAFSYHGRNGIVVMGGSMVVMVWKELELRVVMIRYWGYIMVVPFMVVTMGDEANTV